MPKRKNGSTDLEQTEVEAKVDEAPVTPEVEVTGESKAAEEAKNELSDEELEEKLSAPEINDPGSVFRLALLEERKKSTMLQRELKRKLYDEKIQQLKFDRNLVDTQLERDIINLEAMMAQARRDIEQKHEINLQLYAYDDETGVLRKVVEEVNTGNNSSMPPTN